MASDSQPPPYLSWQFFVLIAAGLGIVMAQPGTLPLSPRSASPVDNAKFGDDSPTLTDSRLWSDPYAEIPKAGTGTRVAQMEADQKIAPDAVKQGWVLAPPGVSEAGLVKIFAGRICLLPVVVRGDPLSEEAREMRIRFRLATASGLGADGFAPDDPSHLMWVNLAAPGGKPQVVPVEWFIKGALSRERPSPYEAVLVVWVKDTMLFTEPLKDLAGYRTQLCSQLGSVVGPNPPAFKVIGPYWSGTLVDILNENPKDGIGLTFYSSTATMADGAIELLATSKASGAAVGRKRLVDAAKGPVLVNLTCNDEELSESLIDELELRGIDPGDANSRIAIVSDWDTDYGRLLPLTFAAKFQQWQKVHSGDPITAPAPDKEMDPLVERDYSAIKYDDTSTWPRQILRAYYLSGVEGRLTADQVSKPPENSKTTVPGSSSNAVSLQKAEGEHQVDYIGRLGRILSRRISERDVGYNEKGKLVAIGILGADVYDKLLLIQALRPLFKGAVFFTDTLDARFMDPVQSIPYTRNLVISTSYGFDLFRSFQVGAPPFRSTEQTGAFLAVQAAAANDLPLLNHVQSQIRPLRFEIGRNCPVALDIPNRARPMDYRDDIAMPVDKFQGLLHPPQNAVIPGIYRFFAADLLPASCIATCIALLYVIVIFVLRGSLFTYFKWRNTRHRRIVLSTIAVLALMGLVLCRYDGVEPATWIEGVSLWPSEVIRLGALATGVYGLLYCHSKVVTARADLAKQFGIDDPAPVPPCETGMRKRILRALLRKPQPESDFIRTYADAYSEFNGIGPTIDTAKAQTAENAVASPEATDKPKTSPREYVVLDALWCRFCRQSATFQRNVRTIAMTASFFAAWIFLGSAIGFPMVPHRGGFSKGCDLAIVLAASLMMIYLMFWVVDETHICLRFVKKLGRSEPTLWPLRAFDRIPELKPIATPLAIDKNQASSYLDVCFIGQLTAEAVPLIILPFVVLTLLVIARWDFFANWRWDPLILMVFGFDAAICICCAVKLRNAALEAKEGAIRRISVDAAMARAGGDNPRAEALEALKALMEANMEGAFLPWHQQPFVSAALLPFGGYGGMGMIEFLMSR